MVDARVRHEASLIPEAADDTDMTSDVSPYRGLRDGLDGGLVFDTSCVNDCGLRR